MEINKQELWTAVIRREQLLELLEGRGPRPKEDIRLSAVETRSQDELVAIWTVGRVKVLSPLPQVIVGNDNCLDDLFAWSGSYLRELGPISGLVRTLSFDQLHDALTRKPPKEVWDVAAGAVGVIVAEVWCRSGPRIGLEEAAVAAPNSTLAYAMVRSWALGYRDEIVGENLKRYVKIANVLGRPVRADISQSIMHIVSTLVGATKIEGVGQREHSDTASWWELLRGGVSVYDVLPEVLQYPKDLFGTKDIEQLREMTAEDRVKFFDMLAPTLLHAGGRAERRHSAFALALTAFLCRPGFLQQATLLREYADKLPEAVLWLGALQVLSPLMDTLLLQSGAGWRIARELYRVGDIFAAPNAEASIAEVEKLSGVRSKSYRHLIEKSRVDIEIYPMIVSSFRGGRDNGPGTGHGSREYFEELLLEKKIYMEKIDLLEVQLQEALHLVRGMQHGKRNPDGRKRGRKG